METLCQGAPRDVGRNEHNSQNPTRRYNSMNALGRTKCFQLGSELLGSCAPQRDPCGAFQNACGCFPSACGCSPCKRGSPSACGCSLRPCGCCPRPYSSFGCRRACPPRSGAPRHGSAFPLRGFLQQPNSAARARGTPSVGLALCPMNQKVQTH